MYSVEIGTVAELIRYDRSSSEAGLPYDKQAKWRLAEAIHKLIMLLNRWCERRKPVLSHAINETASAVQDCDPYVVGLLVALRDRKSGRWIRSN